MLNLYACPSFAVIGDRGDDVQKVGLEPIRDSHWVTIAEMDIPACHTPSLVNVRAQTHYLLTVVPCVGQQVLGNI